jgi:hypothetical protein
VTTPLTEQDLLLLNAYLDDELAPRERADLEARLVEDETLQVEMESLRATVALLGMAQRVPVPRNFTLNPAVYGKPARADWWTNLRVPALATVGVTILVALCVGAVLLIGGIGGAVTQAPSMAQLAANAPAEEAAVATEAPLMAEATEEEPRTEAGEPLSSAPSGSAATEAPGIRIGVPTSTAVLSDGAAGGGTSWEASSTQTLSASPVGDFASLGTAANTPPPVPAAASPHVAAVMTQLPGVEEQYDAGNGVDSSTTSGGMTQSKVQGAATVVATQGQDGMYVPGPPTGLVIGIVSLAAALTIVGVALMRRRR